MNPKQFNGMHCNYWEYVYNMGILSDKHCLICRFQGNTSNSSKPQISSLSVTKYHGCILHGLLTVILNLHTKNIQL